ncbi:MAG: hypothetical protein JWP91_2090 [Fibrobacteres bacterium]|nr:hypothetical protein [Fibrobacterota bacterium]
MKAGFRNRLKRVSLASTTLLVLGCMDWMEGDRLSGNGSEVENAIVVGRVVLASGKPAAATDISFYPVAYDALADAPLAPSFTTRTDTAGAYSLRPPAGSYNLWGHQPAAGLRFLIQDVQVDSVGKVEVGAGTLDRPGRLRVTLPEGSWEGGYVYVPGTPLAVGVDGAADSNGTMLIDSIPACRLKTVLLARKGKPNLGRVLGTDVVINPGETTFLPFTEWAHSAPIRVNVNGILAKRVTAIPLLMRLSAPDFDFSQARGDGADLRFTTETGRILPVHVQSWDSAGGAATVWVKVDTVYADSELHKIRMHWGNPRASASTASVFDSGNGYVGAWHLDAAPSGTPLSFPDESPAGNDARAMGILGKADSMPAIGAADGRIGGGVPLNGKDAYLMSTREYAGPAQFTASFWFRTSSKEGGKILGFVMPGLKNVTYGSKTGNFNFDRVVWMTDDGWLHAGFTLRSTSYPTIIGSWQSFTAATPFNDGQWHHLSYTLWDTGAMLVVDGVKVSGYTGLVRPLPEPGHWRIGYSGEGKWDPEWTSEYFQGSIDEVRLAHKSRSEDWLRLDYESQKPGSTLLTIEKNP